MREAKHTHIYTHKWKGYVCVIKCNNPRKEMKKRKGKVYKLLKYPIENESANRNSHKQRDKCDL